MNEIEMERNTLNHHNVIINHEIRRHEMKRKKKLYVITLGKYNKCNKCHR